MSDLIINAGNSRVVCVRWPGDEALPLRAQDGAWRAPVALPQVASLPPPRRDADVAELAAGLTAALAGADRPRVVLVSVVPRVTELLRQRGGELGARETVLADHARPLPFGHRLRDPAATGADRICNVAAAAAAGLRSALVVDVGTATTCDVLVDGDYLGGVIAPGMAFALEQLGRTAARLHEVPFAAAPLRAAPDTSGAMAAGGYHAGLGGVETLIAGLLAAHGEMPVVVTGGLAGHLAAPGRHLDPDWTLRGAACLAAVKSP